MKTKKKWLILVSLAVLVLAAAAAYAATRPTTVMVIKESAEPEVISFDPRDYYEHADYVFVGTVTEIDEEKTFAGSHGFPYSVAVIEPEQVLKGDLPEPFEFTYRGGTIPVEEYLENEDYEDEKAKEEYRRMFREDPEYRHITSVKMESFLDDVIQEDRRFLFFCDADENMVRHGYCLATAREYSVFYIDERNRAYLPQYQKYTDLDELIAELTAEDDKTA